MRINSIYRSVIGQSIYNRYNSSHNPNVGYIPGLASQLQMDATQDQPVSQRWIQYTTSWSVYNEIYIQYRAGQSITQMWGYIPWLPSQLQMSTMQDWPVSQRWIQYTTGWSVYNEIHIQYRAGQSINLSCRWIHTRLASQSKMDTIHNRPVSLQ